MELEKLYRHRFDEQDLPAKKAVWKVLCDHFSSSYVRPQDVVVDVGAGYCEFINQIKARRRIAVDLNARVSEFAAPGVEWLQESCTELGSIADNSVDVVFMSNFLEHLPSKQVVLDTLATTRRILRQGGLAIILQPNIRLLPGKYWDYFDHHTALTDKSLVEAVTMLDMQPVRVIARFLPYTTKSVLPQWPWLVKLYLRLPLAWWLLGKQSLVVAKKL